MQCRLYKDSFYVDASTDGTALTNIGLHSKRLFPLTMAEFQNVGHYTIITTSQISFSKCSNSWRGRVGCLCDQTAKCVWSWAKYIPLRMARVIICPATTF